jgi:microsomal epoxide hydrolase
MMSSHELNRRQTIIGGLAMTAAAASGASVGAATVPEPFHVSIDPQRLDDVIRRVRTARWPQTARGGGWTYGVDADWFRQLVTYWHTDYDWPSQERNINRLPQFTAPVLGIQVHFVHQRSRNPHARPLLMLHGWPYSFYSFSKVLPLLSDDFHVVAPSLPGSIFSEQAADTPRGLRFVSGFLHALMSDVLGYERYFVDGGDHGAVIADWLAMDRPQALLGEHANAVAFRHEGAEYASGETGVPDPTPDEVAFVKDEQATKKREQAYFELHYSRPETIAYAMADSPVGLAAYLLDKWQKWTDTRRRSMDEIHGRDRLITEVMLYIVTDRFLSSVWPYTGFALEPFSIPQGRKIEVPFGFAGFPDPLNKPPPRSFVERSRSRVVQWDLFDRGGHFPFLEEPQLYADSLRRFAQIVAPS